MLASLREIEAHNQLEYWDGVPHTIRWVQLSYDDFSLLLAFAVKHRLANSPYGAGPGDQVLDFGHQRFWFDAKVFDLPREPHRSIFQKLTEPDAVDSI